ncbi:MAG: 2-keto-4-pentenoate hydratase [bacterium]|nr:2-keto-4-pentenoate hydratase [bacterium]
MTTDATLQEVAAALYDAEASRKPIEPLAARWSDLDVTDAYRIQLHNIERRVEAGAAVRGHKVGLSSRAMQEMMGVDEPDYGHLLDDMFVFEEHDVAMSAMIQPRVEIEVAFVLGDALPARGCNAADVIRATEFVLPAIEIIDSRIADWKIGIVDTIADNASSAKVVLGGNPVRLTDVDVRAIEASLLRNGEVVESGTSAAVLGNPVTAVAWLAQTVSRFDVALEAGQAVLPGSCTRAVDVQAGDVVRAEFDALGHVEVRFT